ncbi:MAG: DUF799 family lipoprotein, partial [Campylobacterota bacterium]|nr:DUF799 family lipoprotein [Campylobacterota bacterium]
MASFIFSGCAPKQVSHPATKGSEFPKMYEQQPRSLLILPPMNESTAAEAKDYYMTTIVIPFASMGYYTFPVEMVSDIMKQEGVYDTELLYNMPLNKFYEYFGADAVLFTHIKQWDLSYAVIASNLRITIDARILSTKSSELLWQYRGSVVIDLSAHSSGNSGLAGLLVDVIATAVNSATVDYVDHAHTANQRLIYSLPFGPYHEQY